MKNKKIRKSLYYLFIISILATISMLSPACDKIEDIAEDLKEYDVSVEELKEVAITEADLNIAYLDVLNIGMRAGAFADNTLQNTILAKNGTSDVLGGEMTLKFVGTTTNPFPVYINADWGEQNIVGNDGHKRRGGVKLEFDGIWGEPGSTLKVYFGISEGDNVIRESYFLDDNKIEGSLIIHNKGEGEYTMQLIDGLFTYADGRVAKREMDITMKWLEGFDTEMDITDDSWELNGGIEGITPSDLNYSIVINPNNSLKKIADCNFPVSGETQISVRMYKFSLDYSHEDEQCDSKAILDFYGLETEISLE